MKKLISMLMFVSFPLFSATVSWDANTESDLAGYKIYYGTESGNYDEIVDVGNVTSYEVTGILPNRITYFAVTAYDYSGNESMFSAEVQIPKKFTLSQNYPNPFNPSTTISYELFASAHVKLEVYNLRERFVDSLVDEFQQANTYTVVWDASKFSSGIYLFYLTVNNKSVVTKGLLVK